MSVKKSEMIVLLSIKFKENVLKEIWLINLCENDANSLKNIEDLLYMSWFCLLVLGNISSLSMISLTDKSHLVPAPFHMLRVHDIKIYQDT